MGPPIPSPTPKPKLKSTTPRVQRGRSWMSQNNIDDKETSRSSDRKEDGETEDRSAPSAASVKPSLEDSQFKAPVHWRVKSLRWAATAEAIGDIEAFSPLGLIPSGETRLGGHQHISSPLASWHALVTSDNMPHAVNMAQTGFQALILCGPGVGLNTFTSVPKEYPKALIPIANRPMVWYVLDWCYRSGITGKQYLSTLHDFLFSSRSLQGVYHSDSKES